VKYLIHINKQTSTV